ncbi:unnamed protein product [Knipowitschia caucasica]|uniref:Uridylate-specific endoribonuclease n=1 Tax=Knipowitschia caucasica TaxID=637954 RepID=A0AAV2L053_KNICA
MAAVRLCLVLVLFSCSGLEASRAVLNQELSSLFNDLWRLDSNRMDPGLDYTLSVQGRAGFVNQGSTIVPDRAPLPLFSFVNETKLETITTFSNLIKLLNNYERSTGVAETVTTEELQEINKFVDSVVQTPVMKRAHQFLVTKRLVSSDVRSFKNKLNRIWFHLYRRQRNSQLDSCGFEHVFVGETRSGNELIGFHNWVQFYLQEKALDLDYKGFKSGHQDFPDQDDHVLNLQFTWHGVVKPVGSAFIGTSPEFEMALYTVLFLLSTEKSTTVLVNIDQCQMELVVVRHGASIQTAYPKLLSSNSRHLQQGNQGQQYQHQAQQYQHQGQQHQHQGQQYNQQYNQYQGQQQGQQSHSH